MVNAVCLGPGTQGELQPQMRGITLRGGSGPVLLSLYNRRCTDLCQTYSLAAGLGRHSALCQGGEGWQRGIWQRADLKEALSGRGRPVLKGISDHQTGSAASAGHEGEPLECWDLVLSSCLPHRTLGIYVPILPSSHSSMHSSTHPSTHLLIQCINASTVC